MRAQSPMSEPVVSNTEPVTLVGGADLASDDLNISLKVAPVLVAADGGANAVLAAGLIPEAVIGDMDSISKAARAAFGDVLHRIGEQDTTDFEKAVSRIAAPMIIAVGFDGARLDHTLSVLNTMARYADRRIVLFGGQDVGVVVPGQLRLKLPIGTRVSLMPLGPAIVSTQGLRWDQTDQRFEPDGYTSPSNETTKDEITLTVSGPVLALVPRAHLAAVTDAVRAQ